MAHMQFVHRGLVLQTEDMLAGRSAKCGVRAAVCALGVVGLSDGGRAESNEAEWAREPMGGRRGYHQAGDAEAERCDCQPYEPVKHMSDARMQFRWAAKFGGVAISVSYTRRSYGREELAK
jgi:hypothetical protein